MRRRSGWPSSAAAKAYNAGDAKAIAPLFVADGEIIGEEGQSTQGGEGIRQVSPNLQGASQGRMDLAVKSIRFIGPDIAVEDGMATVTHVPEESVQHRGPYTVIHVRQAGKWLTASAGTFPRAATPEEQLKSSAG